MDGLDWSRNITPEEAEIEDIRGAVNVAIQALKTQLTTPNNGQNAGANVKATVADLLKLLQLRKELEGDRPRNISARWVDENEC
jgi:hypothetical protein